ncbi:MAG: type II toxin-antitoxin system prevent-host-death family antitoxin [Chloroflexi bacterium]|nr:type II toxin-antitoxin system prevent-host-death family antitoxin [Chloroflexota bacterium]
MQVADLKREFSQVLDAAERGEPTIVLRHGKPVAVVAPLAEGGERITLPAARRPGGLLAVVGLFSDWETMEDDIAEIVAARQQAIDRPAPDLE